MCSTIIKAKVLVLLSCITFASWGCSADAAKAPLAHVGEASQPDKEIDTALELIKRAPDDPTGYNQLAVIYIKRARRTGDFQLNTKAENAVQNALEIAPDDVPARKLRASLSLTFHRFADGLEYGNQLLRAFPNDPFIYGVLTDANAELGNYKEAVAAAQKMVDLKPNSNSYARVAHLRSLHGDHKGAVEMYKLAARTADPQDNEAQSWCLVQLGKELWSNGKYPEANRVFDEALGLIPDYRLAIMAKAKTLASMGDHDGVFKLLEGFPGSEGDPDANLILSHIYARTGEQYKSDEHFRRGNELESANIGVPGEQLHLANLWADHDMNLAQALEIAEKEFTRQQDIATADTLAWCLFKSGRIDEAKKLSDRAVRLNTNDAKLYYHAGMIQRSLGNKSAARGLLKKALLLNPEFDLRQADAARTALGELKG